MGTVDARRAPRAHPAGRAVVLYAVCAPELAGRKLTIEGRRIAAVGFGRFSLLLSYVDATTYSAGERDRRSGDEPWQATEARIHERAVERASALGPAMPLPAFSIVASANELPAFVADQSPRWSRALLRFKDLRECAVHVYAGPHASPFGEPYLRRVTARATRSARAPMMDGVESVEHALELWKLCTGIARSTRRISPLGKRPPLWSATLLLGPDDIAALTAALEPVAALGTAFGVTAYLETPRPPFSFV